MATITPVGIGAAPDDGNGDPLRTAFSKLNTNDSNINAELAGKTDDTVVDAHIADTVDAHDASAISNVAAGNIVATDVQAAIDELDTEKVATSVTLTAGDALSGGGDLSANRTFNVDISIATDDAAPARTDEMLIDDGATKKSDIGAVVDLAKPLESFQIKLGDETTAHTTGTDKVTWRPPYAFTLTEVRAGCSVAPTGSVLTFDINEGGATILSTKLTIDATEKTSTTAAIAAVISDASLADDAEVTFDIDTIGSTIAGAGSWITLIGRQT